MHLLFADKVSRDLSITQEIMREISVIKKKILQYLDYKNISKYQFYQITGISNGILSQNGGISEDSLLRFLNYFPDISLEWLFYSRGKMLRAVGAVQGQDPPPEPPQAPADSALVAAMQQTIATQAELIAELKRRCAMLEGEPPAQQQAE